MKELLKYLKGDRVIWILTIIMLCFSVLTVYSFVHILIKTQGGSPIKFLLKHVVYILIALCTMVWIHKKDTALLSTYAKAIIFASIGVLVFTMFFGVKVNEAGRWVSIPFTGLTFQASDFAKLGLVIYLSRMLLKHKNDLKDRKIVFRNLVFPILLICGLIFKDNFSTAAILFLLATGLIFVGGVPLKHLLTVFGAGILVFFLGVAVQKTFPDVKILPRLETWVNRINNRYSNPDEVDQAGNLQAQNANVAIYVGGYTGQGVGKGKVKEFIPEAYADFYYASFVEEFGSIPAILLVLFYLILLYRIFKIGMRADNNFDTFICIGVGMLIVSPATVNILVCVGIFPVTGQNMPLLAMGGSAMIATCISLGIVQSIAQKNGPEKGNLESKIII